MPVAIVTGAGGLIGSESVRRFVEAGYDVIGIENDTRAQLFGPEASTSDVVQGLAERYSEFEWLNADIRDADLIERTFARHADQLEVVIHTAAQPSHDWAAKDPPADFSINATGTLVLLEATRRHAADAPFVFMSTNKVYGDTPNRLPLIETDTRLELPPDHQYYGGIDTTMSIDRSLHSIFGASKAAADLLVQEYGNYFHMPTVCLRCGCLTGPDHAGTRLHGFLSYLMRCTMIGRTYSIYGYGGKQVRDNLHTVDVVSAIDAFVRDPREAAVYNLGGGRVSNCSMIEAIRVSEEIAGRELQWELLDEARIGDHRWWISDLDEFTADYPDWSVTFGTEEILREIYELNAERWVAA